MARSTYLQAGTRIKVVRGPEQGKCGMVVEQAEGTSPVFRPWVYFIQFDDGTYDNLYESEVVRDQLRAR